jgi:hypothetical protein
LPEQTLVVETGDNGSEARADRDARFGEWAVALRNLGRVSDTTDDEALLKAKTSAIIDNAAWRATPSAGYLESFDVIVHTRNVTLCPKLLELCEAPDNRAVRHAAFLALDRLVLAEPSRTLETLVGSAVSHPRSALMLSNMIARADVCDPAQRQLVESYLLDEKRTLSELSAFAGVFPNANFMVSNNLLTESFTADGPELARRDAVVLDVVSSWLKDPRFSRIHPLLEGTYELMKSFVPN